MEKRIVMVCIALGVLCLEVDFGGRAVAGPAAKMLPVASSGGAQGEKTVAHHAKGTFEPTVTPAGPDDKAEGSTLGRWSLAKKFHGDLEGTSEGQMLAAGTKVKGSAGYVAMERVTGTLEGRKGTFVLQHSGTMNRGAAQLSVSVVPDSGTGQLEGIAGTMAIKIEASGKHFYEFDYTLPQE
jgi:hypothetical protein